MKLQTYIISLFFSLHICYSQEHIYKHFGVDDGLPSSEVYDIYQDKLGYIWFATDKGLSRYNGYEFENFTTKDGLPGNTILDFYPQSNGDIWCYEYQSQSLFYFNDNFNGFKTYANNPVLKKQLDARNIIKSVVFDENETLHVGGYGICGLIEITKEGTLTKRFDIDSRPDIEFFVSDVNLGIDTRNEVFFSVCHNYNSKDEVFIINSKIAPSSRVDFKRINDDQYIFIDKKLGLVSKDGEITYYETEHKPTGIKRIDDQSFFVGYYSHGAEIRDLSGTIIETLKKKKSVSSFFLDHEGGYWFSTIDDGVFYIKNPGIQVFTDEHISSLVKDETNTLYAGFYNGNIARINKWKIEQLYKGLNTNAALVEFDSRYNDIYGYGDSQFINYTRQQKPLIIGASKLSEHIGDSVLSTLATYFYKRKNDSVVRYFVNDKVQDVCSYNDSVLIGTSSGLFIQENDFIKEHHQSLDVLKLRIDDIDLNKSTNIVYMATQGAGVVVYGDSIYNINKDKGLTNNIVSEVHIENDSTVWACTNTGLNRIVFKPNNEFNVSTITKTDGLLSNDIDDIEIINDTIWVATKKGLCYFNKALLEEKKTSNILSLSLKEVTANYENIERKNVKLNYDENKIEFKLQAISHKNTGKIIYYYRLKEIDTTWTKTTNRVINFPSLSPGNYTFEARASILNNPNNLFVTYAFKILPPFWQSWWFYVICFLLISSLVYLFFKVRVLSYNEDVFRELIRLTIKRLKRNELFYKFRSNGEDFKILTQDILYINSQGNYLDIVTKKKTYTIRCKIGDFVSTTPDALEYLRIHRSYIIRIDQVSSKGKNWVVIKDEKIPVGETYLNELDKIQF